MRRHSLFALALLAVAALAPAPAGSDPATADPSAPALVAEVTAAETPVAEPVAEHRMVPAADIKWVDAPPSLPKGAKMAVLGGNPNEPGMFTMRVKVPAGYKVPPHFHPADENLTVLSGDMNMAQGDTWDESKGHALKAGSFATMPKGMHHYAWSKSGAVFQLHAMGPWGITYINPADDPRNEKAASK